MKKSVTPVGIVLCVLISLLLAWFCAAEPEFLAKLPILCALVELLPFALAVFIARNALTSGIFCCAASAAAAVFSVYDRIFAGGTRSLLAPAAAVLAALMVGKYFRDKAAPEPLSRDDFSDVLPPSATVLRDGSQREIPVSEIAEGDIVSVRPGETVPCDGEIIAGRSELDEKPLTGELAAVLRSEGERVMAGSRNISGFLTVRADGESLLEKTVSLCCERSDSKKNPFDKKAAALRCLGCAAVSAVVFATVFFALGLDSALFALVLSLAELSPCAFGAPRSFALLFASSKAASEGVRFRDPAALEKLSKISSAVVDLTGTATVGKLSVCKTVPLGKMPEKGVIRLAAALCDGAEGSEFSAIKDRCTENGVAVPPCIACERLVGKISGTVDGQRAELSSLKEDSAPFAEGDPELEGKLLKTLFFGGEAVGIIALEDSVKPNAVAAVRALNERGVNTLLVSGGSVHNPEAVLSKLGAGSLADGLDALGKAEAVENMNNGGSVAVIADGVSDCAALSAADCGFALASGAGVAKRCASAVLLRNDLRDILPLFGLAGSAEVCEKRAFIASEAVRAAAFAASGILALFGAFAAASAVCAAGILAAPAAAAVFASRVKIKSNG